jgi:hypothetical protein
VVALQVDDFTVDMHVTHSFRTHYPQSLSLSRVQSLPGSSSLRVDGGGHHEHHAGRTTSLNLRLHDSAAAGGGSGTQISEVDSDTGSDLSYVKVGSEVAGTRQVRKTHTPTPTQIACCQTRQPDHVRYQTEAYRASGRVGDAPTRVLNVWTQKVETLGNPAPAAAYDTDASHTWAAQESGGGGSDLSVSDASRRWSGDGRSTVAASAAPEATGRTLRQKWLAEELDREAAQPTCPGSLPRPPKPPLSGYGHRRSHSDGGASGPGAGGLGAAAGTASAVGMRSHSASAPSLPPSPLGGAGGGSRKSSEFSTRSPSPAPRVQQSFAHSTPSTPVRRVLQLLLPRASHYPRRPASPLPWMKSFTCDVMETRVPTTTPWQMRSDAANEGKHQF